MQCALVVGALGTAQTLARGQATTRPPSSPIRSPPRSVSRARPYLRSSAARCSYSAVLGPVVGRACR
jgi:hypothetical protein